MTTTTRPCHLYVFPRSSTSLATSALVSPSTKSMPSSHPRCCYTHPPPAPAASSISALCCPHLPRPSTGSALSQPTSPPTPISTSPLRNPQLHTPASAMPFASVLLLLPPPTSIQHIVSCQDIFRQMHHHCGGLMVSLASISATIFHHNNNNNSSKNYPIYFIYLFLRSN